MKYSIKYSIKNLVPMDIAVGIIVTAIGGGAMVLGYKFAYSGFNQFAHGVGFRVSVKGASA
jgi:hypothetical protein